MTKKLTMIFGVVFILVGLLGFIPNPIVGMDAIFHTDLVYNLVHLVTGIVFVYVAVKTSISAATLKVFGIVYLLVALLGFVFDGAVLGFLVVNGADNWLHLVLGAVILLAGLSGKEDSGMDMRNNMGGM